LSMFRLLGPAHGRPTCGFAETNQMFVPDRNQFRLSIYSNGSSCFSRTQLTMAGARPAGKQRTRWACRLPAFASGQVGISNRNKGIGWNCMALKEMVRYSCAPMGTLPGAPALAGLTRLPPSDPFYAHWSGDERSRPSSGNPLAKRVLEGEIDRELVVDLLLGLQTKFSSCLQPMPESCTLTFTTRCLVPARLDALGSRVVRRLSRPTILRHKRRLGIFVFPVRRCARNSAVYLGAITHERPSSRQMRHSLWPR
jgi:hypothetical protein